MYYFVNYHCTKNLISLFQSFLFLENTKRYLRTTSKDIENFKRIRRKNFDNLYVHGSYFSNFCSNYVKDYPVLKKELLMAKRLEFTHMVLHSGAAKGCMNNMEGIDNLARNMNNILRVEKDIKIILENSAYGNIVLGGDLMDFNVLLNKIDKPELLGFCIDTAHAYAYGYDIQSEQGFASFVKILEKSIGLESIDLIHLNDTKELLGSRRDKHCALGEGVLGKDSLQRMVKVFKDIPMLLEMPPLESSVEMEVLEEVKKWFF